MLILSRLVDGADRGAWGIFAVKFTDQTFLTHGIIIVLCEDFLYRKRILTARFPENQHLSLSYKRIFKTNQTSRVPAKILNTPRLVSGLALI